MKKLSLLYLVHLFIFGLAVIALTGCGTTATHTAYFSAYNPTTQDRNYYRVTVAAHTDDGKGTWQTGWYSRKALDEIFTEVTTNEAPVSDKLVDLYEGTFLDLFTQYTTNLAKTNLDAARNITKSINELIGAAGIYLSAGATAKDSAENAGKRYVYTFSADPTLLERLISDALSSDQTSASLQSFILGTSPAGRQSSEQNQQLTLGFGANKNITLDLQQAISAITQAVPAGAAPLPSLTAAQQSALIDRLTILLSAARDSSN